MQDLKIITSQRKTKIKISTAVDSTDNLNSVPLVQQENEQFLLNSIYEKMLQLSDNIVSIDESNNNYRATFKSWNTILKEGNKMMYNYSSTPRDTHRSIITLDEEPIIEKMLKHGSVYKTDLVKLSTENCYNVYISFFHTMFFMVNYLIILPTNTSYLIEINVDPVFTGLILALTPLSAVLSTLLFAKWSNKSYKEALVFSVICFFAGNFIFASAHFFNSLLMICIGRALVGFGSARVLNRRYILEYLPKNLMNKYGFLYTLCGTIGFALGPIIAFSLLLLEFDQFTVFKIFFVNKNTLPSWICCFFSFILIILTMIFFTEPRNDFFKLVDDDLGKLKINLEENSIPAVSKEDKKMVNEIDRKLSEINFANNFSDTNLVARNIDFLSFKEKNKYSYIFRCFIIINLVLFSLRVK